MRASVFSLARLAASRCASVGLVLIVRACGVLLALHIDGHQTDWLEGEREREGEKDAPTRLQQRLWREGIMAEGEGEKIRARAHLLETLRLRLRRGEEREERDDLRGEALGGVAVFAKT